MNSGGLDGIRVLDLADESAAFTGRLLADLGAEVILVENPEGNPIRHLGPFVDDVEDGEHAYGHLYFGANKKSIVIDRKTAEGRADFEAWFGSVTDPRGRLFDMIRAGQSEVFVFYSGHGVPGSAGSGFLLPVDGDPGKAQLTGYGIETLVANLNKLKARTVNLALDTCFSGLSQGGALLEATSGIYLSAKVPGGITNGTMLTAADGKQIASWDKGAQLGLFTRHLLEGLLGKADTKSGDGNGKVTLAEIRGYLQSEVPYQARRRYGRDQTPQALGHANQVIAAMTAPNFPGFGNAEPAMRVQSQQTAPARQKQPPAASTDTGGNVLERLFKGSTAPKQTEEERFDN